MLQIYLLGGFRLVYADQVLTTVSQPRQQALLTYLLLYRHAPQSRQQIAFQLQPETSETQAKANLRRELYHLRRRLPDADSLLQIEPSYLWWQPTVPVFVDVVDFERSIEEAQTAHEHGDETTVRNRLQSALQLYQGPVLPDCYDEWILSPRQALERSFVQGLELLIDLLEAQRAYAEAIEYAARLLHHDPLQESTYRRLMRLHALHGDRAQALRIYHDCSAILEQELAVGPALATQTLYRQLLQADVATSGRSDRAASGHTPFKRGALVGRQMEWETLLSTWRTARISGSRCVFILGETGIGKSRLIEEMRRWADRLGICTAYGRAYAAQGILAYAPVGELLRSPALHAGWRTLETVWLTELARLLPEVLVERKDVPPPAPMSERWQRLRFFEALARATLAQSQPVLLFFDDLQWYTPETLEWLHFLLQFGHNRPLLVVGAARPEELVGDHAYHQLALILRREERLIELELGPLSSDETARLAAQTLGHDLDDKLKSSLYEYSEGNPLFVVESARAGLLGTVDAHDGQPGEEVASASDQQAVPAKVYAVIQSRLVQLSSPAQRLIHLAATVGRSFTFLILAAAGELPEPELFQSLDELWQRRIIRTQGMNEYDFSHDRIREVAYAEIGPIQRPRLHGRVAQALEQVYRQTTDEVAAQIAAHYAKAGLAEKAINYYQQAARVAEKVYAHGEAARYLSDALALLATLTPTPARQRLEQNMMLALGFQLVAIKGWSHPEVGDVYARALALFDQSGAFAARSVALRGLHTYYQVKADFWTSRELVTELLAMAQAHHDPALFAYAYFHQGTFHLQTGQFVQARRDFAQSIEYFVTLRAEPQVANFRPDNLLFCYCFMAHTLWFLGYPDQAQRHSNLAMRRADELANPFDQMVATVYGATLHQLRGEVRPAQALLATAEQLGSKYDIAYYRDWATMLQGWVLTELASAPDEQMESAQIEAAIARIREGLDNFNRLGAGVRKPYYLSLLAVALRKQGALIEALSILDQASALSESSGERWYAAELSRLQGELFLVQIVARRAAEANAETQFNHALEIARGQQARALELRAATSLARLWEQQDRRRDAYALLEPIYAWFSEGLDTRDLMGAAALLRDLA